MGDASDVALDPGPDPLIGVKINSLVVTRLLAVGGMGAVYIAEHARSPNIRKVIKFLLPEFSRVVPIRQRFVQEAEAAARLQHDNIVRIEDYGTLPDGQCYLVMDYLQGETLEEYLARYPRIDEHRALYIAAGVASALQHAHDHGIVHRDLKPGNIFLRRTKSAFEVVLLDFGIAKDATAPSGVVTNTGMTLGTPAYMAVEQFEDASRVSPSADIYSLGIIVWQMLTGALPWGWYSAAVLYRKQMQERPTPPDESVMSAKLAAVLLETLAVDPNARPPSMRAFAVAMASAIPAVPPDLPSGAEILASVARDLVTGAPHHEMTLRNIASQDRLGAMLWPHPGDSVPVLAGASADSALPALAAPAAVSRPRTANLRRQPPRAPLEPVLAVGTLLPAPASRARRGWRLAAIGVALAVLAALVTFAGVRLGKPSAGDSGVADAAPDRGPVVIAHVDASIPVIVVAVDAEPEVVVEPAAPSPDATPATPPDAAIAADPPKRPPTSKRAPRPPAEPPGAADTSSDAGVIVIRVRTWAEVWVDGRAAGTAPLRVPAAQGRHAVLLVNDDHRETVKITVLPNREAIIERPW